MDQFELRCVKKISRKRERSASVGGTTATGSQLLWRAIESIAYYRMAQGRHVYADLVCPAGIDLYFNQRELAEGGFKAADDGVVGDSLAPATSARGHADAADRIAADAGGDGRAILFRPTMDQGNVSLL